jgi:erythritol kinase (D-erythritol 1-phosphate-forming)
MSPIILAVDAGTSVMKAVAFDVAGQVHAANQKRNDYAEPRSGFVEQDMARTGLDLFEVLSGLIAMLKAQGQNDAIAAIALTGQGDGTWLIDAEGEPVGPALLWLDARAGAIAERLRVSPAGRAAFARTGTGLAACQQSNQLLWLLEHAPERVSRAATAMHCKDWLYFLLTGIRATDPAEAGFTFGNWRTRDYDEETIAAVGLSGCRRLLPPIVDGLSVHHGLSRTAAERLGLKQGLPVVLGALDIICAALGAGLYGSGRPVGLSIIGSTGIHMRLAEQLDAVQPAADGNGYCMPFAQPGTVVQMQSNMAATINIDWVVDLAAEAVALAGMEPARPSLLASLDAAAEMARPGKAVFHPYISTAGERGPFTDIAARAGLNGFARSLGLGGIMRAVYEGLSFAARDCHAAMGGAPEMIHLVGGGARSAVLRGIMAAVLNRPVRTVAEVEAGALGATMITLVSLGVVPSLTEAVQCCVVPRLGPPELPDLSLAAFYQESFSLYRGLVAALPGFWHARQALEERYGD